MTSSNQPRSHELQKYTESVWNHFVYRRITSPNKVLIRVFRFSGIFSNSAISLRIRARGKKYLSDILLEYVIFAC